MIDFLIYLGLTGITYEVFYIYLDMNVLSMGFSMYSLHSPPIIKLNVLHLIEISLRNCFDFTNKVGRKN